LTKILFCSTFEIDPEKFQAPKISKEDGITYVWLHELERGRKDPVE